jgi:hypothetical protein
MMENFFAAVLTLVWVVVVIWVFWQLYITVPSTMASSRRRSPAAWVVIGFLFSPLVSISLLFMLGNAD